MKTFDREKLNKIAKPDTNNWIGKAKWRRANKAWLDKSAKISLKILRHIRKEKITKIQLAEMLGVKPQYVSKILKGHENLTLETITKFEIALGISLIEVPEFQFTTDYNIDETSIALENKGSVQFNDISSFSDLKNSNTLFSPNLKLAVGW